MNYSQAIDFALERVADDAILSKDRASPKTQKNYRNVLENFGIFILGLREGPQLATRLHKERGQARTTEEKQNFLMGLETHFQKLAFQSVTEADLRAYFRSTEISAPSRRTHFYTIKSVFTKVCKELNLETPFADLPVPRGRYKRGESVTREHLRIFINHLKENKDKSKLACRDHIFFNIIRLFGTRLEETTTLSLDSIEITPDELRIDIVGKGNKYRRRLLPLYEDDKKQVPIPEAIQFVDDLHHYVNVVRKDFFPPKDKEAVEDAKIALFLSQIGKRWADRSAESAFQKYMSELGFHKLGYGPHSLRHAFVTHKLMEGVPLQVVSKLVDHANVTVTATIYAHTEEQDMRDAMKKGIDLDKK